MGTDQAAITQAITQAVVVVMKAAVQTMKDTSIEISSEVLAWARQVEARQSQTAVFNSFKEAKDLDASK